MSPYTPFRTISVSSHTRDRRPQHSRFKNRTHLVQHFPAPPMPVKETHPRPRSLHQSRNILEKLQKIPITLLECIKVNGVERSELPALGWIGEHRAPGAFDETDIGDRSVLMYIILVQWMRSRGCELDSVEVSDSIGMRFDDGVVFRGIGLEFSVDLRRQEPLDEEGLFVQMAVSSMTADTATRTRPIPNPILRTDFPIP